MAAAVVSWLRVDVRTFIYPSSLALAWKASLVKITLCYLFPDWSMIRLYYRVPKLVDHC